MVLTMATALTVTGTLMPVKECQAVSTGKLWKIPKKMTIGLNQNKCAVTSIEWGKYTDFDGNGERDREILRKRKVKILRVNGKTRVKITIKRDEVYVRGIKAGNVRIKVRCTGQFCMDYNMWSDNPQIPKKTVWGKKLSFTKTITIKVKAIAPKLSQSSIDLKTISYHPKGTVNINCGGKYRTENIKKIEAIPADPSIVKVKTYKSGLVSLIGLQNGETTVRLLVSMVYPVNGKKKYTLRLKVKSDMGSKDL